MNSHSIKPNTALSIDVINTTSGVGGVLCFQQTSSQLLCSSISPADGSLLPLSDDHPVPAGNDSLFPQQGSALVAAWTPTPGTYSKELTVFYQMENGDIIINTDAVGTWVNSTLPVR